MSDPMEQFRQRFVQRCVDDAGRLQEMRTSGAYRRDPAALSAIAHSLAGAGGTFGFPGISSKAFDLETMLIAGNVGESAASALDALIAELYEVTRRSA